MTCIHREGTDPRSVVFATKDCYWCWIASGDLPSFDMVGNRKKAEPQSHTPRCILRDCDKRGGAPNGLCWMHYQHLLVERRAKVS